MLLASDIMLILRDLVEVARLTVPEGVMFTSPRELDAYPKFCLPFTPVTWIFSVGSVFATYSCPRIRHHSFSTGTVQASYMHIELTTIQKMVANSTKIINPGSAILDCLFSPDYEILDIYSVKPSYYGH